FFYTLNISIQENAYHTKNFHNNPPFFHTIFPQLNFSRFIFTRILSIVNCFIDLNYRLHQRKALGGPSPEDVQRQIRVIKDFINSCSI
ncbi:MAG: hypothetical protein SPK79_10025, partial [Erysipelotrichaceae bacterium]|nr:hypothetical protein [Erysipelotrichaceae bacterium]